MAWDFDGPPMHTPAGRRWAREQRNNGWRERQEARFMARIYEGVTERTGGMPKTLRLVKTDEMLGMMDEINAALDVTGWQFVRQASPIGMCVYVLAQEKPGLYGGFGR